MSADAPGLNGRRMGKSWGKHVNGRTSSCAVGPDVHSHHRSRYSHQYGVVVDGEHDEC
jgi:hypothetical protein